MSDEKITKELIKFLIDNNIDFKFEPNLDELKNIQEIFPDLFEDTIETLKRHYNKQKSYYTVNTKIDKDSPLFCEEIKSKPSYFVTEQEDLMKEKGIKFERVYNNGVFEGWEIEASNMILQGVMNQVKGEMREPKCVRDGLVGNKSNDSKQQGTKESDGKLDYELDWNFIEQMAQRMAQNKGKYTPFNWQKPMDIEKLKQSLLRHTVEIMKGNYGDEGREFGHFESIALNSMMINYQLNNPQVQYKKEDFSNK